MTDRIHSLTVTLERDTRDDDIQPVIAAILQLRGVVGVEMHVADPAAYAYEHRADMQMQELILAIYKAIGGGGIKRAIKALEDVDPRPVL